MTSGLRASRIQKNKTVLKKKVFGPVEAARNERLNAKLMAMVAQPKPKRPESKKTEAEATKEQNSAAKEVDDDEEMDVDTAMAFAKASSDRADKKRPRQQKTRHRRAKNEISFKKHNMKGSSQKSRK